ncbi:MAG: transcription-repair coupling factor [Defluviitaleaceae bacterium]|nr:transcription-repair coupling factor [Defluviitaleaceae bacterium]
MFPNKTFEYPLLVTNLNEASKPHAVSHFNNSIFITATEERAKQVGNELQKLSEDKTFFYPKKDLVFYSADVRSKDITNKRFECLNSIFKGEQVTIVLSIEALFDRLSPRSVFKKFIQTFKIGEILDVAKLSSILVNIGYERVNKVEAIGQFAIRGGILDFYPPISPLAFRIELFDNEIDSIRTLDPLSQRSIDKCEEAFLFPVRELVYEEELPEYSENSDRYLPFYYEEQVSLFDYLNPNTTVIIDEPNMLMAHAKEILEEYHESVNKRIEDGKMLKKERERLLSIETLLKHASNFNIVLLANFITNIKDFSPKEIFSVDSKIAIELEEKAKASIQKPKRKRKQKGQKISNFTELKIGDYIVHDNHGVGIYSGIETITTDGVKRDYIKLHYADEGKLFIPTDQLDRVQKYIGGSAKLHKLGGSLWEKSKKKAKENAEKLAKELAVLYAKRNEAAGFVYTKDTVWQTEFEENFGFEETTDQINAIRDVKEDMESTKIMDRLICGDVGFGKTEVAIRAAFKAVDSGKQVAFLCPTTILAQQHYNTFKERMKDYPIGIELLCRFRSKKEQKESLKNLEAGEADIIIGTHRLLSKDVSFKNLGLVIVDEEQRFGITHKEKLKELTINVDILTLTATPIPRTLHMSLSGIRDISILEEPPIERKTIQTFVLEQDEQFIKTAITRELSRGGQVYYLHNRVVNIEKTVKMIKELVPSAEVAYAHGQMSEVELEDIMFSFINNEIDILICTTIIETGLDIPNVNTIIIEDADKMGLSQLYQLRGRVGRSDRIAYSYLMYKKDKVLNEIAAKRLQTIRDFTEFGAGFKIAMKDLEIRGVGSLLGPEQSGHMAAIGYDMYSRLLEEAVLETRGEVLNKTETNVDIKLTAYLPTHYIKTEEDRLEIYKKIFHITDREDYNGIWDEMVDRFGDLPKTAQNLLDIAMLKAVSNKAGITSVAQKGKNLVAIFKRDAPISPIKITSVIKENKNILFTAAGEAPYITYKPKADELTISDVTQFTKIINNLQ